MDRGGGVPGPPSGVGPPAAPGYPRLRHRPHTRSPSAYAFKNRPTCGYYTRGVTNGVADPNLYSGTPVC